MQQAPRRRYTQFAHLLTLSVAFLLLAACQSGVYRAYSGEPRTAETVARLSIPAEFNLLYINGEKYTSMKDGAELELLPGKQQLVIEYDVFWSVSGGDYLRVSSEPAMLSFTLEPGKLYGVKSLALRSVEESRLYAKKLQVELIEQGSGQAVAVTHKFKLEEKANLAAFINDAPSPNADKQAEARKMLEYWWRQAAFNEQQAFLEWAKSNTKVFTNE